MTLLNAKYFCIYSHTLINIGVKFIIIMLLIKIYSLDLVNNNKIYYPFSKTKHAVVKYSFINLLDYYNIYGILYNFVNI